MECCLRTWLLWAGNLAYGWAWPLLLVRPGWFSAHCASPSWCCFVGIHLATQFCSSTLKWVLGWWCRSVSGIALGSHAGSPGLHPQYHQKRKKKKRCKRFITSLSVIFCIIPLNLKILHKNSYFKMITSHRSTIARLYRLLLKPCWHTFTCRWVELLSIQL